MDLSRFVMLLIIVSLIAQPLMTARFARRAFDDASTILLVTADAPMFSETRDKALLSELDLDLMKAHCLNDESDQSSMHCADCGVNCDMNDSCGSCCFLGSVAAIQISLFDLAYRKSFVKSTFPKSSSYNFPPSIFHPPKYA